MDFVLVGGLVFVWAMKKTYSVTFLAQTAPCFNIPVHLYIYDQDLQQTFGTLACGVNMYESPIWANTYFTYLATFLWLKRIPTHQLTQNLF